MKTLTAIVAAAATTITTGQTRAQYRNIQERTICHYAKALYKLQDKPTTKRKKAEEKARAELYKKIPELFKAGAEKIMRRRGYAFSFNTTDSRTKTLFLGRIEHTEELIEGGKAYTVQYVREICPTYEAATGLPYQTFYTTGNTITVNETELRRAAKAFVELTQEILRKKERTLIEKLYLEHRELLERTGLPLEEAFIQERIETTTRCHEPYHGEGTPVEKEVRAYTHELKRCYTPLTEARLRQLKRLKGKAGSITAAKAARRMRMQSLRRRR